MNKIAFPTNSKNLEAKICQHFGRANNFLIYDLNKDDYEVEENPEAVGEPIAPPDFLAKKGVDRVACFGLRKKAIDKFSAQSIKVYKAKEDSIKGNLKLFKKKQLKENVQSC